MPPRTAALWNQLFPATPVCTSPPPTQPATAPSTTTTTLVAPTQQQEESHELLLECRYFLHRLTTAAPDANEKLQEMVRMLEAHGRVLERVLEEQARLAASVEAGLHRSGARDAAGTALEIGEGTARNPPAPGYSRRGQAAAADSEASAGAGRGEVARVRLDEELQRFTTPSQARAGDRRHKKVRARSLLLDTQDVVGSADTEADTEVRVVGASIPAPVLAPDSSVAGKQEQQQRKEKEKKKKKRPLLPETQDTQIPVTMRSVGDGNRHNIPVPAPAPVLTQTQSSGPDTVTSSAEPALTPVSKPGGQQPKKRCLLLETGKQQPQQSMKRTLLDTQDSLAEGDHGQDQPADNGGERSWSQASSTPSLLSQPADEGVGGEIQVPRSGAGTQIQAADMENEVEADIQVPSSGREGPATAGRRRLLDTQESQPEPSLAPTIAPPSPVITPKPATATKTKKRSLLESSDEEEVAGPFLGRTLEVETQPRMMPARACKLSVQGGRRSGKRGRGFY